MIGKRGIDFSDQMKISLDKYSIRNSFGKRKGASKVV